MKRENNHLNKSEVGTVVPTSDGTHPRPSSDDNPHLNPDHNPHPSPNRHLKLDYHIPPLWPVVWLALFLTNIIFSLLSPSHDLLTLFRISGIALCLLYAAKTFPKDHLLFVAMLTTCISDIILVFNNTSELGLITFLVAQIIHLFRLASPCYYRPITVFAALSGTLILLDFTFSLIPLLFLIASLYAFTLTLNIVASFRWHHAEPTNPRALFALIGFVLFACCDFCTMLSYLSLVAFLPAFFYAPANFFAWFFYYPSQVLISCSSKSHISPTKFIPSSRKYAIMSPKEGKC